MSRASGPATVRDYTISDDGSTVVRTRVVPARSPYEVRHLTTEEYLCILTQTGTWAEDFMAPAYCGLQPGDGCVNSVSEAPFTVTGISYINQELAVDEALRLTGIMYGYADTDESNAD